ncbi:MAG: (Fe-S)-binding protein [Bacteroidota bacterium]|nr:(Fe-S)-binding protein [Bacteroidota bacterium]
MAEPIQFKIYTMAEMMAMDRTPEILFWVGCAGSFDQRAQSITKAFVKILNKANVDFAVLGTEESCTGDPARRAGNEFIFQMKAAENIQTLNAYGIKRIVTACPHCFNTLKNEYPELGGNFEVIHHTVFLQGLLDSGKISIEGGAYKGKKITYHDSCYLGRANDIYEAPRKLIMALDAALVEMPRSRKNGFCCGAGGAQVFKDAEPGRKEVYMERADEAIATGSSIIAAACPFCMIMLESGVKEQDQADNIKVLDIAELIANAQDL